MTARDRQATWVTIMRDKAQQQPELAVCTFLADGEAEHASVTYAQLDARARAVAAELQVGTAGGRGAGQATGHRALLLYPPGLEYIAGFLGCLYAGLAAVPIYFPHLPRLGATVPRLRAVVADAQPDVVLTTAAGMKFAPALASDLPELRSVTWVATDDLDLERADGWRDPSITADAVAFIQYTSGSTGAPKGVVVTHGNTLHNSAAVRAALGHSASSVGVIWLPPYHDMGLVGGILQPLYVGFPVVLLSPLHFLQRPLRWLAAISRYRATTTAGPNFAYELCVRRTTPEQRTTLDLCSLESAVVGAEPINPETIERFCAAFAPCGLRRQALRPSYGLAESTLMVTASRRPLAIVVKTCPDGPGVEVLDGVDGAPDRAFRPLVSCGLPAVGHSVVIVNPESGMACPPDTIGEIWVAGPSVGMGYWNRPDETAATFRGRLAESTASMAQPGEPGEWPRDTGSGETPAGPFLRTGDLGFLHDGELFITGRLKDLIIIRGQNYYPADIEWTVGRSHPGLRPGGGVAFSISSEGEEHLVVVHETERQYRPPEREPMIDAVQRAVMEQHGLLVCSVRLVRQGTIPRTSSGKAQRSACREAYLAGAFDVSPDSSLTPTAGAE
jgi:acyl-CoA synthetase (AMP-forming)/AMP-acid ligase II